LIVVKALFNLLLEPIILESIFLYQANSKTNLTEDQAFNQVHSAAGIILITDALFLTVIGYKIDPQVVIFKSLICLYAS